MKIYFSSIIHSKDVLAETIVHSCYGMSFDMYKRGFEPVID